MERLTMTRGICQMASTEYCQSHRDCYECEHGHKVFHRLAAYEDTDLLPDEIPRWIPVSERLPDKGECLVVHGDGTVHPASVVFPEDFKHCTHWMPLPNPPKEEK